jgi:hypothetical protein
VLLKNWRTVLSHVKQKLLLSSYVTILLWVIPGNKLHRGEGWMDIIPMESVRLILKNEGIILFKYIACWTAPKECGCSTVINMSVNSSLGYTMDSSVDLFVEIHCLKVTCSITFSCSKFSSEFCNLSDPGHSVHLEKTSVEEDCTSSLPSTEGM